MHRQAIRSVVEQSGSTLLLLFVAQVSEACRIQDITFHKTATPLPLFFYHPVRY